MKQHSSRFLTIVNEAKANIKEISPKELKSQIDQQEPVVVIDVREESEWETGHIANSIHISKGVIERDIEKVITDPNTAIVVYCSGGYRCALVAESLQKMGYMNVSSLNTGLQGWLNEGFGLIK
ncbi:rhodanese-like domain-containing protein [Legionella waltersii]|uniref:Rhodanese domain-containing protein n=1 Tax=Legionella waltersii TaxID=66969 RepID=A0A0W1AAU9_9GAMM|nr:rhodanese-like domain-containing protein [Legionella waltersii]KTD78404.1 rhodanese domain-containing protein [Legionella waltersii]SNV06222.1 rhodanese domain protein [Legionella waltersii]